MYKLRELEREDIKFINDWRYSKELIDSLGAPYRYINKQVDYEWYEFYMKSRNNTIRCTILNENDEPIGLVSLTNIDRINQSAVFHIMIGEKAYRGKGAGNFAASEIIEHAFNDINLRRIELSVLESNTKAIRLYEKVGFVKEGVKRKAIFKNGDFIDIIIMSILKEDYRDRR